MEVETNNVISYSIGSYFYVNSDDLMMNIAIVIVHYFGKRVKSYHLQSKLININQFKYEHLSALKRYQRVISVCTVVFHIVIVATNVIDSSIIIRYIVDIKFFYRYHF